MVELMVESPYFDQIFLTSPPSTIWSKNGSDGGSDHSDRSHGDSTDSSSHFWGPTKLEPKKLVDSCGLGCFGFV